MEIKGYKGTKLDCEYKFNYMPGHTPGMIAWGGTIGTKMRDYYGTWPCKDNHSREYSLTRPGTGTKKGYRPGGGIKFFCRKKHEYQS